MALSAPTLLNSKGQTAKRIDIVSGSVSPASDCLLVVGTCRHDSTETLAISTTLANVGAWTQVTIAASGMRTSIFYAKVTGAPGTGTITISGASALSVPWRIEVCQVTGHDLTTPVPQSNTGQNAAAALTVTLPSVPAAASMVFGYLGTVDSGTGPVTPGTGFTELSDTTATSGSGRTQVQYDLTNADDTCDWSNLSTTNNAGIAIEIAEAGGGTPTLVVADAVHGHTADTVALTQVHNLTTADAAHGHTSDTVALTQEHNIAVADSVHEHTVDGVTLSQTGDLVVADSSHGHTVEAVTLTQQHVLSVADSVHEHTSDSVVLTQVHVLTVSDALHSHSADNVVLTQIHDLVVADSVHGHTVDVVNLSGAANLVVADSVHGHTVESVALGQVHVLSVSDSVHGHTADVVVLTQQHILAIQDALHAHTVEGVTLSQLHVLVVADAQHEHTVDDIVLSLAALRNLLIIAGLPRQKWGSGTPRGKWATGEPREKWEVHV